MAERTEFQPGTPSWVDLGTPDIPGAAAFYTAMFGWDVQEAGPVEVTGGYRMAMLRGRPVAGLGPQMNTDMPPYWSTYITVADADATAAAVEANDGKVIMPPMDVMTVGRMGVFLDCLGAAFSIWQPRDHVGAGIVNEPGTLCWNELACRDVERAKSFYSAVFGWDPHTRSMGDFDYTEWHLGDRPIGGMIEMNDQYPPEMPANWLVYLGSQDCDESALRCTDLGGAVIVPPADIPEVGRFSVVRDPYGAVFALISLVAPAS
jgi:uncharacterized protein